MRSPDSLSSRQEKILNFIKAFQRKNGYSPAIRDIQKELEISSTSVVAYNLRILENKGRIARDGKISRGITVPGMLTESSPAFKVPLLGVITAGSPLPDPEQTDPDNAEQVDLPAEMAASSDKLGGVYALRVRGHSMIDALIDDGDIVLLRYQLTAENGQLVAARLLDENAVTLKKFYHEGERIRLQPANVTMEPIFTSPDNLQIHGRVVGVIRNMV